MRAIIYSLFLLGICLLTYDSLPFINFSVYRPVAMFPLFAASVLMLFEYYRFRRGDIFLIAFLIYSTSNSLIQAAIVDDIQSSLSHIITLVIGISVYRVSTYAAGMMKDERIGTQAMTTALLIAFIPGVIAGFMQLVDGFFLHSGFSKTLTGIFSEQIYQNRIQMLSGEPSWAAIHMITGCLLFYFLYKRQQKWSMLFIALVALLIATFSAYAYSVILIALFIFMLINGKNRLKMLLTTAAILGVIFLVVPYLIQTFGITGYYVNRFNLDKLSLTYLMENDNSFFVRFVFPLIGFMEFLRHPITGLGGGFYYREFADLLLQHFDGGLKFKEVYDITMISPETATSRNLFAKLFSEEGLIGVLLFFGFLITVLRKSCTNAYSKFVFALCLAMVMNFDSYAFVDFWLLLGLIRGGFFDSAAELSSDSSRVELLSLQRVSKAQYS